MKDPLCVYFKQMHPSVQTFPMTPDSDTADADADASADADADASAGIIIVVTRRRKMESEIPHPGLSRHQRNVLLDYSILC